MGRTSGMYDAGFRWAVIDEGRFKLEWAVMIEGVGRALL